MPTILDLIYIANHWNPPVVLSPQNDKVYTVPLYVTTVYSDKGTVKTVPYYALLRLT